MSLLTLTQEFCRRTGLSVPLIVSTSQDDQYLQIMGLLNETLDDICIRQLWPMLQYETTFTSIAAEIQITLETSSPGFQSILFDTVYDRTRKLPVFGPRGADYWQQQKALPFTGPYYQYRIEQGYMKILPVMVAGHSMAYEYQSVFAVVPSATPTVPKVWFTLDTDTCKFSDQLLMAGLRWRWKKEKGFRYDADFQTFETMIANLAGRDSAKGEIRLDGTNANGPNPGIFIPAGNWNIP